MVATPTIKTTQARVLAVYNFPTATLKATQLRVQVVAARSVDIHTTQLRLLVVGRGRLENRHLRAWGFTLDEHDFWVIRLGETETLIYDDTAQEWYVWNGESLNYWRAHLGFQWVGQGQVVYANGSENNIIAGDDDLGILWQLVAGQGYDDHSQTGDPTRFTRIETGLLPMRLRGSQACNGVYVTGSMGEAAFADCTITLKISDDGGETFWTASPSTITGVQGDYDQEIAWRSLGLITAPGRIFSLEDDGISPRIDGLDMLD